MWRGTTRVRAGNLLFFSDPYKEGFKHYCSVCVAM